MTTAPASVRVNGRQYAWPRQPVVVVCVDGSEPDYTTRAIEAGCMPYLAGALATGTDRLADCVVPSFTNPNNLSIITGVPPVVHGICGNYFYDPVADAEVMMNDPSLLRSETIFQAFQSAGARIAVVTAKDKLRRLLGNELEIGPQKAICFSAEKADSTSETENGVDDALGLVGLPLPSVYSADLTEFAFAAGVKLMQRYRPDLMYLSTTDYVQHKHAPGSEDANAFYRMMDGYLAQLDAAGAVIAITADHGMSAKHTADGSPDVLYLQSLLDEWLGEDAARVILPITDPYVVHHGALGGFATAYLPEGCDAEAIAKRLADVQGVECALPRTQACERFELPADRVGDVVVVSTENKAIGSRPDRHDLNGLDEPLRSHGGISEQRVPLLVNRPAAGLSSERQLRNFDIFDIALNHAQALDERKAS